VFFGRFSCKMKVQNQLTSLQLIRSIQLAGIPAGESILG